MADLALQGIRKSFGPIDVLKSIDLNVSDGEFVVFVGPSGCGKSTLLRVIAGLEGAEQGEIRIDREVVNDREPAERGIAMVFQSYALYPHMTVRENMAFGLSFMKLPKSEVNARVEKAAAALRLEAVLERKPAALSGGQRQRVAIGRAIVREPRIFLFDEPLSNLDAALRVATRIELAKLHRELKATMIYVTHDQVEAMTLADKIVVLNEGHIEQVGSPLDLYHAPASRFVASFIGSPAMNFVSGRCVRNANGVVEFDVAGRTIAIPAQLSDIAYGDPVEIGMRPEHFVDEVTEALEVSGTVEFVEHLGETSVVYLRLADGQQVVARRPGDVFAEIGSTFTTYVPTACLHAFGKDGRVLLGRRSGPPTGAVVRRPVGEVASVG